MAEIDREFLRKLTEWDTDGYPVASVYLDIDGRRYPRKQDYMVRAEQLCHQVRDLGKELERAQHRSVEDDARRIQAFLTDLDRGSTRGVALFSCSARGLWQEVRVPRPTKDRACVAAHPYVMPLEVVLETYESFCTVIVDREKARIFLARMGRIAERTDVFDEVPGQHDQGGWSQARYQRHIDEHAGRHLKRVGELLLAFFKRRGFDHLILAGPEEVVSEFERSLHDYLKRRIAARLTLPMTATAAEVLERSLHVEEDVEARREAAVLETLLAESSAGRAAVTGLSDALVALNDGRVGTLVLPVGLSAEGVRCSGCGRLGLKGKKCTTCGAPTEKVPDIVETAVAAALQQSSRVEILSMLRGNGAAGTPTLDGHEVGALLRY